LTLRSTTSTDVLGAVKFADHAHGDGARRNNGTSALGSGAIV